MSKSIKLKNNNFLDSRSVSYNRLTLYEMIASLSGSKDGGLAQKRKISGMSLNDIVEFGSGIFIANGPCTNTPSNDGSNTWHWHVVQSVFNSSYCVQLATAVHSDKRLYVRHMINNQWDNWKSINDCGTYLLSGGISRYEGDIELNDSINNYDYLVCAVGAVGEGTYVHTRMMPFATQYTNGTRRATWRINSDIPVALTVGGSISFEIPTERKLRIKTNATNTAVRAIYGVKL